MILSDREAKAALSRGAIRIDPDPSADSSVWSSTAIDLRLGTELAYWELPDPAVPLVVSPGHPDYDYLELVRQFGRTVPIPAEGYPVEPGKFYLGWTRETIQLPHRSRIAARVEGKSNLARLGLGVHVTAPTIHAGFGFKENDPTFRGNPIQLEIWNAGPFTVTLMAGMKICQLIFEYVDGTPEQGYSGRFAVQGPVS
jgi:dCTP deaminase